VTVVTTIPSLLPLQAPLFLKTLLSLPLFIMHTTSLNTLVPSLSLNI